MSMTAVRFLRVWILCTAATAIAGHDGTPTEYGVLDAARPMVIGYPVMARLGDRFHHGPATEWRASAADGRVTNRPRDAESGTGAMNAVTMARTVTTTMTALAPGPTVYGTEHECASAASAAHGDRRWPCVCYTTDYLDWVGERLDEAAPERSMASGAFECPYYKAVTAVFVVRPADDDHHGQRTTATVPRSSAVDSETVTWKPVDFDRVADYRLQPSANDHFAVHYGLVGGEIKVLCSENGGTNKIKWKYQKFETKSTIIDTDSNELTIMGIEPADTKNYSCSSELATIGDAKIMKSDVPHTHYIIAVEKPIYEIRGTATYKTSGNGNCTHKIIRLVQKQFPALLRTEVCPVGSTRYACKIIIESANCTERDKILGFDYLMTLNDKADIFNRIRTSKNGRNALYYQQIVARISNVLATNLKKTLSTVQIVSKISLIDTYFKPDHERNKINTFVTCTPGFGLREVFCAACPPHHYSPDKSTECLKCPKNFHQPVTGSDKCVKCPTPFASGCYMDEVTTFNNYYVIGAGLFLFLFFFSGCCFCCRKENKYDCLHSSVRRKFKLFKKKDLLPKLNSKKSIVTKGKKIGKSLMRFVRKPKQKLIKPSMPFDIIHEKMDPHPSTDINNEI